MIYWADLFPFCLMASYDGPATNPGCMSPQLLHGDCLETCSSSMKPGKERVKMMNKWMGGSRGVCVLWWSFNATTSFFLCSDDRHYIKAPSTVLRKCSVWCCLNNIINWYFHESLTISHHFQSLSSTFVIENLISLMHNFNWFTKNVCSCACQIFQFQT